MEVLVCSTKKKTLSVAHAIRNGVEKNVNQVSSLVFFVPYNKYKIVEEVYCWKQLSVSGKYFNATKKLKLWADCQFNEPSTL